MLEFLRLGAFPDRTIPSDRKRSGQRWQRLEQMAVAGARLVHMEAFLEFPDPRRHGMNDRDAEILFQQIDDAERSPAGAEHVDRVGALAAQKALLDMGVDLL